MHDRSDFSDEDLEITELPEREEMLSLTLALAALGLDLGATLGLTRG